jgi:hypothetical protein
MKQYGVGQDEFIFHMYSIALIAILAAATVKGDLYEGIKFLSQPGTYNVAKVEQNYLEDAFIHRRVHSDGEVSREAPHRNMTGAISTLSAGD